MQRLILILVFLGCFSMQFMAQDYSKVQLFGGFQDLRLSKTVSPVANATGWDASGTYNFVSQFGIQGDVSGSYQTVSGSYIGVSGNYPGHYLTYAAGPVFTLIPKGRVHPYVNALFGATRVSSSATANGVSVSASKTGFTSEIGGGVDIVLSKRIAIRTVQAEWLYRCSGTSVLSPPSPVLPETIS